VRSKPDSYSSCWGKVIIYHLQISLIFIQKEVFTLKRKTEFSLYLVVVFVNLVAASLLLASVGVLPKIAGSLFIVSALINLLRAIKLKKNKI
jgi:hypothetical protein